MLDISVVGMIRAKYSILLMILSLIIAGCSVNQVTGEKPGLPAIEKKPIPIIDGCHEEYFVYSEDLGICEKKGTDKTVCNDAPLADKLKECEESNQVIVPVNGSYELCEEKVKEIDPFQYSLINSIKNNCLHNFAIALRDDTLCDGISYESHKEICISDIKKIIR